MNDNASTFYYFSQHLIPFLILFSLNSIKEEKKKHRKMQTQTLFNINVAIKKIFLLQNAGKMLREISFML